MSIDPQPPGDSHAGTDFSLPLVAGGTLSLAESLRGKRGAVVVFWSSVCSHCVRYDPCLNQFATRYPEVALLAVASRENETLPQLRDAIAQRALTFPLCHDADRAVAHQWRIRQTPTSILLGSDRRTVYRGAIDNFKYPRDADYQPYLDAALDAWLSGKTPARPVTPTFGCPIESVYYRMPKPLGR